MTTVRLGYAMGTGLPVDIPIRNMCVAGQTQEAGKTTALEGLIARSGLRAVTFVTKRGEGSFTGARRLRPYFREQADWQFVASILEASRGERLKFERPWIIRASQGAKTLADVAENVKRALRDPKVRGMSADIYLTLNAYLDVVVPAIAAVEWARRLELAAGVNAMDLTLLPLELQHLVIKSALDWVLEHERDTVVVIPEAWKFVPEGRGTPVKRAADALIRQGSGLGDYVWLDSQDLGGVAKEVLRHCPVWLLGVQREANEIKRTLANIPANVTKPKPGEIATLGLGQFLACWGHEVVKTYAQPAWLLGETAAEVARGSISAGEVRAGFKFEGDDVGNEQLEHENSVLRRDLKKANDAILEQGRALDALKTELLALRTDNGTASLPMGQAAEHARLQRENARLQKQLDVLERKPARDPFSQERTDRELEALEREEPAESARLDAEMDVAADPNAGALLERIYPALKARLLRDATLLALAMTKPALEVQLQRRVVTVDASTLRGRVARLMAVGWFKVPRTLNAVRVELTRTGKDPGGGGTLGTVLGDYVVDGFLVREGSEYRLADAVDVSQREISAVA